MPPVGLEPTTYGLKGHSSNQLSYRGTRQRSYAARNGSSLCTAAARRLSGTCVYTCVV